MIKRSVKYIHASDLHQLQDRVNHFLNGVNGSLDFAEPIGPPQILQHELYVQSFEVGEYIHEEAPNQ